VTRTKYELRRKKVRLQDQLEALLEEAHIQIVRFGFGYIGRQRTSYAEGAGRR